jgi:L-aminopeptidase/D-esterase-like protein
MRCGRLAPASVTATLLLVLLVLPMDGAVTENRSLTAVRGLTVGHHTLRERPTGCTVVLAMGGAVAGVDVRGAAPGTRETDLLAPVNTVDRVHAIVLAGGSAFGLDAASGVVRWLEERKIGFETTVARIPIVPAAILFDLGLGDPAIRPTAECGYAAASTAHDGPVEEGSIGAGAGATVGKLQGMARATKGGIGSAAVTLPNGLVVAALVAVNARGDVIDPESGQVVAGTRGDDGVTFSDARRLLRSGAHGSPAPGENTPLGVVATNARLTKTQATKMAQMAHDGFARAIAPSHTPLDGDAIFALATGERTVDDDLLLVGALAADATSQAVVRAVREATSAAGVPAVRDLSRR